MTDGYNEAKKEVSTTGYMSAKHTKLFGQRDISNPSSAISNQHKKNDFGKRPRGVNKAMNV